MPCPFLPLPSRVYTHDDMHALGKDRSAVFYHTALNYAQSLWLAGFPAKSLLLINRALSCKLTDVALIGDIKPYHAIAWILLNRPPDRFIGNPRRHYQHLATRMVEPHKELRIWRAWACWYLAKQLLDEGEFPPDAVQVREELIVKPRRAEIASQLKKLSPNDDLPAWQSALSWAQEQTGKNHSAKTLPVTFRLIGPEDVDEVWRLANLIWHDTYPGIISVAQIDYMLKERYAPAVLRDDLERGVHMALIRQDCVNIGFLAWEAMPEGVAFLHKLYVLPERHGFGVGAQALRLVAEQARAIGMNRIRLRVNRKNLKAIRAYLREGFSFEQDVCTEIGNGYVMDDHVMSMTL